MSKLITKHLSQLSLDEINEIKDFINSPACIERERKLWESKQKDLTSTYQKNRAAREATKLRHETELYPALKKYAINYLFPGDIVKFQNANSGGYRQIVKIEKDVILGLVVRFNRRTKLWETSGYSSENSITNLSEVYLTSIENTNPTDSKCWYNRKDIVKFINEK